MNCPHCNASGQSPGTKCTRCGRDIPAQDPRGADFDTTEAPEYLWGPVLGEGERIGNYEVVRELGRGGMGVVYLVRNILTSRKYALKLIIPELSSNPVFKQRFLTEVTISQELSHRNIVKVYQPELDGELLFFTMEYLPGRNLREFISERKGLVPPFSLEESCQVLGPVLEALEHAHTRTPLVVHRDLKPENIMVVGEFPDVRVKVLDFGLAKVLSPSRLTKSANITGTAYYMAPEQLEGGEVDHRADLYATGVVLYEMLTGRIPQGRFKLPGEMLDGVPAVLDELLDAALQATPEDRPESAFAMRQSLRAIRQERGEGERQEQEWAEEKARVREEWSRAEKEEQRSKEERQKNETAGVDLEQLRREIALDIEECMRCINRGKGSREYIEKTHGSRLADWQRAAALGWPEAQWLVGRCLEDGYTLPKDEAEAERWHRRAAEQGYAPAQTRLLYLLKDKAEGMRWLHKAAEQGYAEAQSILSFRYRHGLDVKKDEAKGVYWCRKAAKQGYAGAQYRLGRCYESGEGVPQDKVEAARWYRKAADQGDADAQARLVRCYRFGIGVAKNNVEVTRWIKNIRSEDVQTCFIEALNGSDYETAQYLLNEGADVDGADERGVTALWSACVSKDVKCVRWLLSHDANPNQADESGDTPLYIAALGTINSDEKDSSLEIMKLLIAAGADVNHTNDGLSIWEMAGSSEAQRLLERSGAKKGRRKLQHKKRGCFISSAVSVVMGWQDEGPELNALRAFRDDWMQATPQRREEVREYYRIAPDIVRRIDASADSVATYRRLCDHYILPALAALDRGRPAVAHRLYRSMVESLCSVLPEAKSNA